MTSADLDNAVFEMTDSQVMALLARRTAHREQRKREQTAARVRRCRNANGNDNETQDVTQKNGYIPSECNANGNASVTLSETQKQDVTPLPSSSPTPPPSVPPLSTPPPTPIPVPPIVPQIPPLPPAKEPVKAKAEKPEVPPDPRHQPVTDGYCTAYLEIIGSPYVHSGGRDGKKLKALLATANPTDFPADKIVKMIRAAMKRSNEPFAKVTKFASTLGGFCEQFNAIRAELNENRGLNGSAPHRNGHEATRRLPTARETMQQ